MTHEQQQCPTSADGGQLIFFGSPCTLCAVRGRLKKKHVHSYINMNIYIVSSCSSNLANFMDPSPAARFSIVGLNQWISSGCLGWNAQTSQIYHQIAVPTLISWFYWLSTAHRSCLWQRKSHFRCFTSVETPISAIYQDKKKKKSSNSCELSVLLSRVTLSLFWWGSAACSANECACADVLHH